MSFFDNDDVVAKVDKKESTENGFFDSNDIVEPTGNDDAINVVGQALQAEVAEQPTAAGRLGQAWKQALGDIDSSMKATITGAQPGLSIGTSDEIAGAIGAAGDYISGRGELTAPENETTYDQFKRLYAENRDRERNRLANISQENPSSYLMGDIGGSLLLPYGKVVEGVGVLTGASKAAANLANAEKLAQAEKTLETMQALKKAQSAARMNQLGTNVASGGVTGFAEGVGRSEGETTGDVLSDATDMAVIGGGIPVAGEALRMTGQAAKHLVPKPIRDAAKKAFSKGREGIDTTTDEFGQKASEEFRDVSTQIADENARKLENAKQARLKVYNEEKARVQAAVDNSNAKIAAMEAESQAFMDKAKQAQALEKEAQTTANAQLKLKLQGDVEKSAQTMQKNVNDLRTSLSDEYSAIDRVAEDQGARINTVETLNKFYDDLANTREFTPDELNRIKEGFLKYEGEIPISEYAALKREINAMTGYNPVKPMHRGAAKQAYGNLVESFSSQLNARAQAEGNEILADVVKRNSDVNRKWSVMQGIEDFVEGTRPDAKTGKIYAQPTTMKTIQNLADPGNQAGEIKRFQDYYNEILPPEALQEAQTLSQQVQAADNFKPQLSEIVAPENPQLAQAIAERDALKAQRPVMPEKTPEEKMLQQLSGKNRIMSILPETGNPLGSQQKVEALDDLQSLLRQNRTTDEMAQMNTRIENTVDDVAIGRASNPKTSGSAFTNAGLWERIYNAGTGGGTVPMANRLGRAANWVDSTPIGQTFNKFQSLKSKGPAARNAAVASAITDDKYLTERKALTAFGENADPEELTQAASGLRQKYGKNGERLAQQIEQLGSKSREERKKLIFSILDDPNNKRMLGLIPDESE